MISPGHPYDRMKRVLDVVIAALALFLGSLVMLVTAALVAAALGRPVLFRQTRPGLRGEPFELIKFRTMRVADPARGQVTDAERLTRLGRWLRASSLDELPSFWNVLRGDMSVVGPRPLLMQYLAHYTPEQARRHDVRPGVTGLAQVRGRNELAWADKFAYDIRYVDQRCLRLDLRIIAETVRSVVSRTGITAAGSATAPEFVRAPEFAMAGESAGSAASTFGRAAGTTSS
jgi:lipopolysaccharide/colanic/teichoic acid biosynthesis glycosyltransferase